MDFYSRSEQNTSKIARDFASELKAGDIVTLHGDLGSGKTTFVKAIAKSFGIERPITSPTFVIMKSYQLPNPIRNIEELVHIDAYRLDETSNLVDAGLADLNELDNRIVFIEWPEKIANTLPANTIHLYFEYIGENERKINIR